MFNFIIHIDITQNHWKFMIFTPPSLQNLIEFPENYNVNKAVWKPHGMYESKFLVDKLFYSQFIYGNEPFKLF